jgi:uncharacterized membrane protein
MMWLANTSPLLLNEMIGSYHGITAHFPTVLFAAALICDLLYYFGKLSTLKSGHWLVILGVIACMPALFTGIVAAHEITTPSPVLAKHISLGYMTAIGTSLYAGLRISDRWWQLDVPASLYIMIDVVIIALISWTSDYGWLSLIS